MIGDKLKEEIRRLYLSFDETKSYYEKGFIWSFLTLASDLFSDDDIEQMFQEISYKCVKEEKGFLEEQNGYEKSVGRFMKENKKFFHLNIPMVSGTEKKQYNTLPAKNYSQLISILESFLKSESINFYNFYKKMVREERIIMGNNDQVCFSSLNDSNTFIFIEKFDNLRDVLVLVHELAHSYYYDINKEVLSNRHIPENEIKDEIPSKMEELKFIAYLHQMNLFKTYWILRREYNNSMYRDNRKRKDFDMMKYVIGCFMAYQLFGRYNIEDYFQHVYQNDFHDLILEACGVYSKEKGKVLKK